MKKFRTTESKPYNLRKVGGIAKSNSRTTTNRKNVTPRTIQRDNN
jgi:hypothetical protein